MVLHIKDEKEEKIQNMNNNNKDDDIEKIIKKIEKYDNKRKEYESKVYNYYNERREREKNQIGWNQAASTIPIISHIYSYFNSVNSKNIDEKEIETLNIFKSIMDSEYDELLFFCNEIKKRK